MTSHNKLIIGGFQKQSLIDYPGNISAVIFTYGCNFRCNYCHNRQLIGIDKYNETKFIKPGILLDWIFQNKNLLDAVVVTGGEPTLHEGLPLFIQEIRKAGLKIKLDTNGTNPDMVEHMINKQMINYVAMDIKSPLISSRYREVVGKKFNYVMLEKVIRTVNILKQVSIDFEFRTTSDEHLTIEDFISIGRGIIGKYYIQNRIGDFNKSVVRLEEKELDIIKCNINSPLNIEIRN